MNILQSYWKKGADKPAEPPKPMVIQVKPVLLLLAHMHGMLAEYGLDNEDI